MWMIKRYISEVIHENRGRTAVKGVIKMSAGLSALKARTAKQFASREMFRFQRSSS